MVTVYSCMQPDQPVFRLYGIVFLVLEQQILASVDQEKGLETLFGMQIKFMLPCEIDYFPKTECPFWSSNITIICISFINAQHIFLFFVIQFFTLQQLEIHTSPHQYVSTFTNFITMEGMQ